MLTNKETPNTNHGVINEINNATLDDNDDLGELEAFNENESTEEINNDNITIADGDNEENDEEEDNDDDDIIDETEFDDDDEESNKNNEKEEKDSRKN